MSSTLNKVEAALQSDWLRPRPDKNGVIVPTACIYPSGAWVCVYVVGGDRSVTIHDSGGALWEAKGAGIELPNPDSALRKLIGSYGVLISPNGVIRADDVPVDYIAPTLGMVANASMQAARSLFDNNRPRRLRAAREQLKRFLDDRYRGQIRHGQKLSGESRRHHKFEHLIAFEDGRRIVMDFATPDRNAVNSRVVAHLDIKRAQHSGLEQKIIYDESENWDESMLALLNVGADTAPLTQFLQTAEPA